MSDKLNIEEVFNQGFEGAELSPSPASWKAIQRKLRWRQFLRFRPGRFNIYYAGAILLAGIGLTWALTSNGKMSETTGQDEITSPSFQGEEGVEDSSNRQVNSNRSQNRNSEAGPETQEEKSRQALDTDSLEDSRSGEKVLAVKDYEEIAENDPYIPDINPEPETNLMEEHLPVANFTSSIQSGCAPLKVQFIDQSMNATSYHWDFGTGDISKEQSPLYEFDKAGLYIVTLTTENHGSQPTVSRMMIEVLESPVADFQIEKGLTGMDEHVVLSLVNYSTDAASFSWSLVDEECTDCSDWSSMDHQPSLELKSITPDSRSVRLEVINDQGCRDTAVQDLPLIVESSETKIKFATAFSPNTSGPGDGSFTPGSKRIDVFHPIYIEVPMEFHLRIFTRRGELVFETREIYQGWDGYINQVLAANDVYVWMADGKWKNGESFSFHGDVTLVRGQYW